MSKPVKKGNLIFSLIVFSLLLGSHSYGASICSEKLTSLNVEIQEAQFGDELGLSIEWIEPNIGIIRGGGGFKWGAQYDFSGVVETKHNKVVLHSFLSREEESSHKALRKIVYEAALEMVNERSARINGGESRLQNLFWQSPSVEFSQVSDFFMSIQWIHPNVAVLKGGKNYHGNDNYEVTLTLRREGRVGIIEGYLAKWGVAGFNRDIRKSILYLLRKQNGLEVLRYERRNIGEQIRPLEIPVTRAH